jgi:succinoglycan biosynthesis protein ExoV
VTEAMHGAIVSDALRTPWVAMRPIAPAHRAKWGDWAGALDINLRSHDLPASNLREAWSAASGLDARGRRSRMLMDGPLGAPGNWVIKHRAAKALQELARAEPQLSGDVEIERATARALEAIDGFLRRRAASGTPQAQAVGG